MDPAVALLIFLITAVVTVVIRLVVQQHSSTRSTRHLADPSRLGELGERRPSEDAGRNQTIGDERRDGSPDRRDRGAPTRQEELRRARAERLDAVAYRERRYAERAEAQARRVGEESEDELGRAPNEQRARRAGIATDDLDY